MNWVNSHRANKKSTQANYLPEKLFTIMAFRGKECWNKCTSWFVGLIQNLLPLSFAFCQRRRRLLKIMIATASMWCLFSAAIFENDFKKNSLAAYCLRMNEWIFRTCDRRISQPALRSFYVSLLRSFQRKRNVRRYVKNYVHVK